MTKKTTVCSQHILFFGTVFTLLMAFSACKNDAKPTTSTPITGNNVYLRLPLEPNGLNLLTTEDAASIQVGNQIFQSLLEFDPKTLELTPVLAKSRPTITTIDTGRLKGGTAHTYEIRDEAAWPNGTPVTAADVVFTVKAILNKKSGANNLRTSIDFVKDITIDAANPKKFAVLTDKRFILAEANFGLMPIVCEKNVDTEGALKNMSVADLAKALKDSTVKLDAAAIAAFGTSVQQPKFSREPAGVVGSGPYELAEWKSGERLVLKKKANWWGDKLAASTPILTALPDQIFFKIIADEAAALALVKDGQLDVAARLPVKRRQNDGHLQFCNATC
jgi:peptide/nickel transport system substrate-binding protein